MCLKTILCLLLIIYINEINAQSACTVHGQTPMSAFPVCGIKDFTQTSVPECSNRSVPGCGTEDTNPFWYRFTCYKSGTLGFLITPKGVDEDYDWQLFDITGHLPNDVYTTASLTVTANWAGTYGNTGASASGVTYTQCGSYPADRRPTFAAMPNIIEGHTYLLLISHFSDTQSGYTLSFNGGSASITDPLQPALTGAAADCEGTAVTIILNKKMQCASLAKDGSDFTINAPGVTVTAADAVSCTSGFDMDSLVIRLNKALAPGDYTITVKKSERDKNTLLDYCDNAIPDGASVPLTVLPKEPTPLDSLTTPLCAAQTLQLVFDKPMRCSSIAGDGSDFVVNGPQPVTILAAAASCTNGTGKIIEVRLAEPLAHEGLYSLVLKKGSDGNALLDECGQETPAGSSLSFRMKDTVSAVFSARLQYGCKSDTVMAAHDGSHGVTQWAWTFDGNFNRTTQSAQIVYSSYGEKRMTLIASNGFCSDTATGVVNLDNELKAGMKAPDVACPNDPVSFTDSSTGNIIAYRWNFGLPALSFQKNPPVQTYRQLDREKLYTVSLVVENNLNCFDTAIKTIKVPLSCYIAIPSAFTPNGDGKNDFLYPLNAYKADNADFRVYNRYGQLVYHTADWTKKWDGTINGRPAGSGTFIWMFSYTHHDTGKYYLLKGSSVLIR